MVSRTESGSPHHKKRKIAVCPLFPYNNRANHFPCAKSKPFFLLILQLILLLSAPLLFGETVIPEQEIRQLVDAWVAAQNRGDFAGYGEFYAAEFKGIKRSGKTTSSYTRDTWLQDRQAMFKTEMQVTADDLVITADASGVKVRFIQVWASGNYKDAGSKLLQLRKTGMKVSILYEEMLDSYIIRDEIQQSAANTTPFLVLNTGYLILSDKTEPDWARGAPLALPGFESQAMAVKDINQTKIPAHFRKYPDLVVNLYTSQGERFLGRITDLKLAATVIPHFGTIDYWRSALAEDENFNAPELAEAIWDEAGNEGHFLVAEITRTAAGPIPGVLVMATVFGDKEPEFLPSLSPGETGYNLVEKTLTNQQLLTPEVMEDWGEESHPLDFLKEYVSRNGTHFLALQVLLTSPCSVDALEVGQVWELKDSSLTPRLSIPGSSALLLIFDINGNGIPDLIFQDYFSGYSYYLDWKKVWEITIPYHDCPC